MKWLIRLAASVIVSLTGCIPLLRRAGISPVRLLCLGSAFLFIQFFPSVENRKLPGKGLQICGDGCELLILFLISTAVLILFLLTRKEIFTAGGTLYLALTGAVVVLAVAESGRGIADRIRQIIDETGCEKVNIIAHSKGGLDSRYAITRLGMAPCVASLTAINTPHRGCIFADYLLQKISEAVKEKISGGYNTALRKLGDKDPDFISAVTDLTASACKVFNQETPDMPGVFYQSVGSKLNQAANGQFPLNFSQRLVAYFDGPNDGLVAEGAFRWGSEYTFLQTQGKRGISHGDMIDLNRENIRGFDVREFYVQLVYGLKNDGCKGKS